MISSLNKQQMNKFKFNKKSDNLILNNLSVYFYRLQLSEQEPQVSDQHWRHYMQFSEIEEYLAVFSRIENILTENFGYIID
jgi:hypothetical protein